MRKPRRSTGACSPATRRASARQHPEIALDLGIVAGRVRSRTATWRRSVAPSRAGPDHEATAGASAIGRGGGDGQAGLEPERVVPRRGGRNVWRAASSRAARQFRRRACEYRLGAARTGLVLGMRAGYEDRPKAEYLRAIAILESALGKEKRTPCGDCGPADLRFAWIAGRGGGLVPSLLCRAPEVLGADHPGVTGETLSELAAMPPPRPLRRGRTAGPVHADDQGGTTRRGSHVDTADWRCRPGLRAQSQGRYVEAETLTAARAGAARSAAWRPPDPVHAGKR